jgi:hypothetical protein
MTKEEIAAARKAIAAATKEIAIFERCSRANQDILIGALPAALDALDAAEAENAILKRQISTARASQWQHVRSLRAGEDTRLLDWTLENRAVVVDGTVYKGCSWRTGDLAGFANPAPSSLAEQRRAALRAAIAEEEE